LAVEFAVEFVVRHEIKNGAAAAAIAVARKNCRREEPDGTPSTGRF
jgi:hypothetical protein